MRVTVGIPFLNAELTLPDTIRSVFAQTFEDWELLLVDDGSTDRSLDIARAVRDPRVRVVSDGKRRRVEYRLNQIADLAQADYLARMDADDMMHPQRVARQVGFLESNPEVDVVATAIYTVDAADNLAGIRHTERIDLRPAAVLVRGLVLQCSAMARTQWWRSHRYDETFNGAEDHELWCRACRDSLFARLSEPMYYYREGHHAPWPYLRHYRRFCRSIGKCYVRYGPPLVGWPKVVYHLLRINTKLAIYALATAAGAQHVVIRNRQQWRLSESQYAAALKGFETVKRTKVPGLDSGA